MSKKMSQKNKNRWRVIGIIVASVLASVLCLSWVGSATSGFQDWDLIKRNEENVIPLENLKVEYGTAKGNGFTLAVKDDGVIELSGENKSDVVQEVTIGTVTLNAGKYIMTSGMKGQNDKVNNYSYEVVAVGADGTELVFDTASAMEVSSVTVYTLKVRIQPTFGKEDNGNLYVAIYPDGTDDTDYFA